MFCLSYFFTYSVFASGHGHEEFVKFHIADNKGTVRLKNHTIFENHAVTSGRLAAAMD